MLVGSVVRDTNSNDSKIRGINMPLRKGFGVWSELIERLKYKLICLRNAFLDSIAKEEIKIHREELDSTLKP